MLLYCVVFIIFFVVSVFLRLSSAIGIIIPLSYGLIAPTLFYDWFHTHQQLAEGIGWALIALVAISWIMSLVRKIAGFVERKRDAEIEDMILLHRLKNGQPIDS